MVKYQQYDEYKDSEVEWLEKVPSHWQPVPIKYLASEKDTLFLDGDWIESKDISDSGIRYITTGNVGEGQYKEQGTGFISDQVFQKLNCSEVFEQDILISRLNLPIGRACLVPNLNNRIVTSVDNVILRPDIIYCKRFLVHLFSSSEYFHNTANLARGATMQRISRGLLGNIRISLPEKEEQVQIANFLDFETAQIDTLIEKQQTLIQLLKEKRQAVISHAVTKGLNPDSPMKDSGVEWLGEVPEHWEIMAISKLTQKITNGYVGPTRDILVPNGVPYIQATHIKRGNVNFDDAYFVREEWSKKHSKSILREQDVLVVQTGAGTGDIGLVTSKEAGYNCHALIILQPKAHLILGGFLSFILQSDYGYAILYSIRTGGMHPHLNCGEVKYVKVSLPPIDEQQEIISYIERMKSKFNDLIDNAERAIQLMQERRTALISAAVTGKIDVRGWVAPKSR
ncbi:restriction endonuclease subunit S [Psychrobacter sp. DM4]|uniref:restriction endonuclease subunit S n=1 Tax=Psychrobacter sp. DM4 TaxID=3440637 RepID=UPI003F507BE3